MGKTPQRVAGRIEFVPEDIEFGDFTAAYHFIDGFPAWREITLDMTYSPSEEERDVVLHGRKIGRGLFMQDGDVLRATLMEPDARAFRAAMRPQAVKRANRSGRHAQSKGMRRHVRREKADGRRG